MELEVKYPNKTIILMPWYTEDVEIIEKYLRKMRIALYRISEFYRTNEMFIDHCSVLPLTYVILREQKREWVPYAWYILSDKYAVILPDLDEDDDDYIDEKEACFIVEPYYPFQDP